MFLKLTGESRALIVFSLYSSVILFLYCAFGLMVGMRIKSCYVGLVLNSLKTCDLLDPFAEPIVKISNSSAGQWECSVFDSKG